MPFDIGLKKCYIKFKKRSDIVPKINPTKFLENVIKEIEQTGIKKSLLLHSCCAPCSSYVLEYLSKFFDITVFYYNPNIYPEEEYYKRAEEQVKFTESFLGKDIKVITEEHRAKEFYDAVKGFENEPEGGARCRECFYLRLSETAKYAKNYKFDYFTTTLSISPHKNAEVLNEVGGEIADKTGIPYLFSDFKKKNGYLRSTEISKQYGIYRQDYCGCVFSMKK